MDWGGGEIVIYLFAFDLAAKIRCTRCLLIPKINPI
jgi:hypothetical protein